MADLELLANTKLCFIAGTLGQGGAERQLFYILKVLRQAGAAPHLLCLTRGEFWEEPILALGVPVTWVGAAEGRWSRVQAITAACREIKPQVVQSQHFYTNLYAAVAARRCGAREIGAVRSGGLNEVIVNGRALGWLSLNFPRIIAANSRDAVAYAQQQGLPERRVCFLPNVIDSSIFATPERQPGATLRLLTVGRLEPQKRMDRLLNLIAQLREQYAQPIHLKIAGGGALRESLEEQVRALNLSDLVEFCGVVKDTAPLYRAADLFVLTSDYEGTPNVVMEAMAAGLPIICTNVGGVPQIMQHGESGLMFDPTDEAGMLAALLELAQNPARRAALGQAASRHIETHHSLARLPHALAELYQRTLL